MPNKNVNKRYETTITFRYHKSDTHVSTSVCLQIPQVSFTLLGCDICSESHIRNGLPYRPV